MHFRNKLYPIFAIAKHTETDEELVIYQAIYGDLKIHARPYDIFASQANYEKYPDVKEKYRSTRITFIDSEKYEVLYE